MKKEMKAMAVLSASMLFALGAAMTAYGMGWTQEGESWVFYDRDGELARNLWKHYDNQWYWLGADGRMMTDSVIEFEDNYFYVDDTGAMVKNQWIQVENREDEGEGAPDNWWYYFGTSGKAYKCNQEGNTALRLINGKRYAFDEEAKMLFGWVDESSTRQTDEDAWTTCPYYFGDENDGAASMGWVKLQVIDNDTERWDKKGVEGEDQDYWFYFQADGRKVFAEEGELHKTKTINGMKYSFDQTGRMTFEWTVSARYSSSSTASTASNGNRRTSANSYSYFNDREDGARIGKGWFKVVPDPDMNQKDYEDGQARWFYAYSQGKLCASEFRTIGKERYCFDNSGGMLTNTQAVYTDGEGRVWNRMLDDQELLEDASSLRFGGDTMLYLVNESGYEIDDELSVREALENVIQEGDSYGGKKPTYGIYCFGSSEDDGEIRTGRKDVTIDSQKYSFYFQKDARTGRGWNGVKDGRLYQQGKAAEADEYVKYEAYFIAADPWKIGGGNIVDVSSSAYQDAYSAYCGYDDPYFLPNCIYYVKPEEVNRLIDDIVNGKVKVQASTVYLVDSNAKIAKNGRKKDGDGCYYELKDGRVLGYYEENDDGSKSYINYGDGKKRPGIK